MLRLRDGPVDDKRRRLERTKNSSPAFDPEGPGSSAGAAICLLAGRTVRTKKYRNGMD
jgi:hypothetical protein